MICHRFSFNFQALHRNSNFPMGNFFIKLVTKQEVVFLSLDIILDMVKALSGVIVLVIQLYHQGEVCILLSVMVLIFSSLYIHAMGNTFVVCFYLKSILGRKIVHSP